MLFNHQATHAGLTVKPYLSTRYNNIFLMIPFSLTVFTSSKSRRYRLHSNGQSAKTTFSGNLSENETQELSTPFAQQLIAEMAIENRVDGAITGIAGTRSRQYERFEWLKNNAEEEDLISLTDHVSPVVRVYAFYALYEKRSMALTEIYRKHINDYASFLTVNGNNQSSRRVNECFSHMLQYCQ